MKKVEVSVSEFKAKSLGYFDEIAKKGTEIIITKRGEKIAAVIPIKKYERKRGPGRLKSVLIEENDILSPLDDEWEVNK